MDDDRPVKVADNIYWMGTVDRDSGWMPNPYLIVDHGEAVLIDAGSGAHFAFLIMKIMQIGLPPSAIKALIYQSYDPRLWGSLRHLEALINRKDLKVISHEANLKPGREHMESATLCSLEDAEYRLQFSSGRSLEFIQTPFAPSAGSFVTCDRKSGVLFSGDLFSSHVSRGWNLFLELGIECRRCEGRAVCPHSARDCPVHVMLKFHRETMSSEKALRYGLKRIAAISAKILAPHQGSVIRGGEDIAYLIRLLASLEGVGIDGVLADPPLHELVNTAPPAAAPEKGTFGGMDI